MKSPTLPPNLLSPGSLSDLPVLPDNMFAGSTTHYLDTLEAPMRKLVGTTLLRLLASQRAANTENGEALKVLASIEREVLFLMGNLPTGPRNVWVDELKQ